MSLLGALPLQEPRWLWLAIPAVVWVVAFELRRPGSPRRRVLRMLTRSALALLLLVALAGPEAPREVQTPGRLLVIADRSDDLGPQGRQALHTWLRSLESEAHAAAVPLTVLPATSRTGHAMERPPTDAPPWPVVAGRAWPLDPVGPDEGVPAASHLQIAAALADAHLRLGPTGGGAVLVLSRGGMPGEDDAVRAARDRMREDGIAVLGRALPDEVPAPAPRPRVVALRVPEQARGPVAVQAQVEGPDGTALEGVLRADGAEVARGPVAADGTWHARLPELTPGVHEVTFHVEDAAGPVTGTSTRRILDVQRPPRALALVPAPERSAWRLALSAQGIPVAALGPDHLAAALASDAAPVDLLVADPASLAALTPRAQDLLRERVREGMGLLVGPGESVEGWEALIGHPMAQVLPWQPMPRPPPPPAPPKEPTPPTPTPDVDPPEDDEGPGIVAERRPGEALPITLLLVVDRSWSMRGQKLAMAIEGARRAAQALSPWDRVGVITFSERPNLDFAPRSVRHAEQIPRWLSTVQASGGTDIFRALSLALRVLKKETTPIQHLVLISDGETHGVDLWSHVMNPLRARGVTLTAIGIGDSQDRSELRRIATLSARGTVLPVYDIADLPTVMSRDTREVAQRREVEAERLDRLRNPDAPPREADPDASPEPAMPPPMPAPELPTPPETPDPPTETRRPVVQVRRHDVLLGIDEKTLPDVGPPRSGQRVADGVALLSRHVAEEEPVLLARRHGLGRVLQWTVPDDDLGLQRWAQWGTLLGQAAHAVAAPVGSGRWLPHLQVRARDGGAWLEIEWPAGDAPVPVEVSWSNGDRSQTLPPIEPATLRHTLRLPDAAPGERIQITARLADGRALPPLTWLTPPPPTMRERAGDHTRMAALFGPPPARAAAVVEAAAQGPTRSDPQPLWPWFLAWGLPLLVLDVWAHRRGRLA